MSRHTTKAASAAALVAMMVFSAGCPNEQAYQGGDDFPRLSHSLLPEVNSDNGQLGAGMVDGIGLTQPIAFPHYTHVTGLNMQCEYCHQAARKSIHGGVPQTETCMNCHTKVKTDSPEIKKLTQFYKNDEPTPWNKVHDVPDFVHFAHNRHVQAGVDCTECHGQMGLQGQSVTWTESVFMEAHCADASGEHAEGADKASCEAVEGQEWKGAGTHAVERNGVRWPVVRETTMQMGWCLDCHGSHPSIDKNYGEKANLRRAELKDCWTCHK